MPTDGPAQNGAEMGGPGLTCASSGTCKQAGSWLDAPLLARRARTQPAGCAAMSEGGALNQMASTLQGLSMHIMQHRRPERAGAGRRRAHRRRRRASPAQHKQLCWEARGRPHTAARLHRVARAVRNRARHSASKAPQLCVHSPAPHITVQQPPAGLPPLLLHSVLSSPAERRSQASMWHASGSALHGAAVSPPPSCSCS